MTPALATLLRRKSVTINAIGTKTYQANGASLNYTGITVAPGARTALLCTVARQGVADNSDAGIALTWDSGGANQAMTLIVSQTFNQATTKRTVCQIWGLRAPVPGNKTLAVAWTNAEADNFIVAIAFNGVEQASDSAAFPHTGAASAAVATVSVASRPGNKVVAVYAGGSAFAGILGTAIYTDNSSGSLINAGASYSAGAANVLVGGATAANAIVGADVQAG